MSKQEILDREARWARPAAFATIVGVACAVGAQFGLASLFEADNDPDFLKEFADESSSALPFYLVRAFGLLLLGSGVIYLFRAAQVRSDQVRGGIVLVLIAGSVFLAGGVIASYVSADQVASDFAAEQVPAAEEEDRADELLEDSAARNLSAGLSLGGGFGLGLGSLYTALWAMRTGLLSRFFGSFGMATGVAFVFLPFFFFFWAIYLGLLFAGWVPRGRPPAWAAGEAVPWPRPGEEPMEEPGAAPGGPVEGSGREVSEPPLPEPEGETAIGQPGESPGETQGQRRKKRKRRG